MAIQRSGRFERIKKPLKSDMNVVPYIDVMLVLLVIFMVTAPMITTGVDVDLPQASSNPIESKENLAIVTIDKQGQYLLKDSTHNNEILSLEQLKEVLNNTQTASESQKQKFSVLVNGDKARPYGDVMSLMGALQDAGLSQVGLLTEPLN